MSFLNPLFLFALFAIGLPLLIHLMNLRKPQKVHFSTLTFFQQLKNTTIKRIRIKKYLLLFLRVAAIICLALVLARPFLPPGLSAGINSQEPAINAVLIDNSISMERIGKEGPLIEYAKNMADLVEQVSKEDDRFILQTTNGEPESGNVLSRANFQKALQEINITKAGNYTVQRISQLLEQLIEAPFQNKKLFIISDGQRSQFSELQDLEIENIVITFIDAGEVDVQNTVVQNVSTSTNMIGANIPLTLNVEVENLSEIQAVNQFLTLQFEGEPAGQYTLSLQPGESKIYNFEINPSSSGTAKGLIQIEGDAFQADNDYYFSINIPAKRTILWIEGEETGSDFVSYTGAMLQAAGENDAQLEYKKVKPNELESVQYANYDAIILDGVKAIPEYLFQNLQSFVQNGKGLIFFPSETGELNNYNNFLSQFNAGRFVGLQGEYASFQSIATADELLEDHTAFTGLFDMEEDEQLRFTAPNIYYYWKYNKSTSGTGFDLLSLNNGDILVHEKRFGEGNLLISAIGNDPGWSNFPIKPLFAPFYYRILLYAAASDEGGFAHHQLGTSFSWTGNIDVEEVVIRTPVDEIKPNVNVAPNGIRISYSAQEWTSGWITVTDGVQEYEVALNLDRAESDFDKISFEELETLINDADITIVDASKPDKEKLKNEVISSGFGKEIWHWFLLAGFLFLITETLVSTFYKTETVS